MRFRGRIISNDNREILRADRTYYVRTDGNDANDGLANTAGGAWLTLQKAVNTLVTIDMNGFVTTVQIGDGTYTGGIAAGTPFLGGIPIFQGNSGDHNAVVISTTSADAINISGSAQMAVKNLKLQTTTSGFCCYANGSGTNINLDGVNFGACATYQIIAQTQATIKLLSNYTISGAAQIHAYCEGAVIVWGGALTVTITGTPAFQYFFVGTRMTGLLDMQNIPTWSGAATGQRYDVRVNGAIMTNGQGATYIPGNSPGVSATGGQYA